MNMKAIAIVIVCIIIIVAGFFLLAKKSENGGVISDEEKSLIQENTLGGTLYDAVPQNPAEKIPESNPFRTETNPYKGAYTNPFE